MKWYEWVYDFFSYWWYKIFVRGHCALVGCKEQGITGGYNMPDDCTEWWCKRCGAEGINSQVTTRELFYGDDKLKDFISALKGL